MAAPVLQFKRGLLTNLPGLRAGEPGFTTDSYDLYVGLTSETSTNKFFGSHRYWTKETTSTGSGVNLVEGTSNGTSYLTLKAPDSLAGIGTYVFPDSTDGSDGDYLKLTSYSGGVYSLEWAPVPSGSFTIQGDTGSDTFTTGETLTFTGGEGIDTAITDNTVTISAEIASASNAGVASFSASYFSVTAGGDVSIANAAADGSTKGVAAFDTDDFDASSGVISLGDSANGAVLAISATDNETTVSRTNGTVTVGLPDNIIVGGALTVTTSLDVNGGADISGGETTLSSATVSDLTSGRVVLAGTSGSLEDSGNLTFNGTTLTVIGLADLDDVNISSAATITTADIGTATIDSLTFTSGTAITSVDTDLSTVSASDDTLASAKAIKAYVDSQVTAQDLDFAGDSGTGAVDLDSQSLTIAGTANEIETSASGQTITIGLPDTVVVGTAVSVPTVKTATIQHSNATQAATIDSSGNITASQNLTVSGNLYVNGSTTQVNTAALTVEDRTIDLGIVNGSAPSATTTWDLGVLFNYYTAGAAKKSAVVWEHSDSRFKFASVLASDTDGSDNDTPQLTVTTFAPIEISALWVNDCAGSSQVISCTGTERFLENITIDAGTF